MDLGIDDDDKSFMLGAFFFTYALFQIPVGALADRFGARLVLTVLIAAWSAVTAATGFVSSYAALLAIRLLLGITEAGAYPAAAGLVKRWARPEERGRFSSVVALGGRIGGAASPYLTAVLAVGLIGVGVVEIAFEPSPPVTPLAADETPRANWRGVFAIYGLCGLIVAALFGLIVRDRPPHPSPAPDPHDDAENRPKTRAEEEHAEEWHALPPANGSQPKQSPNSFTTKLLAIALNWNMFYFAAVQFGVNLGWVFLITLLPTYLNTAYGVPLDMRGQMQSVALITGCCGMFLGGFATDLMRRWLGPRYGRSIPIGVTLGFCSLAFLIAPLLPSAWAVVAALGLMAFLVDMHNPSIWSFAQDVGGKNVAQRSAGGTCGAILAERFRLYY